MKMYEIEFYKKEDGECPVRIFLDQQNAKMRAKIFRITDMLEQNGPEVRMPYSKMLDEGIFEIRAIQGNNITRVLYFFLVGKRIILTNGFTKKTKKTPDIEIELAKKYRADYERRLNGE